MTLPAKKARPRTCRVCPTKFVPMNSFQVVCSAPCSIQYGRKEISRKLRSEKLEARKKLLTRPQLLARAQSAFNRWVRLRDAGKPCISCGRHHQGQWHAGHYRTVKAAPELRFDPDNVHAQCAPCNNHLSGNILEYRIGLLKRIGVERVEALGGPHPAKKYTAGEILEIEQKYKALAKELEGKCS